MSARAQSDSKSGSLNAEDDGLLVASGHMLSQRSRTSPFVAGSLSQHFAISNTLLTTYFAPPRQYMNAPPASGCVARALLGRVVERGDVGQRHVG